MPRLLIVSNRLPITVRLAEGGAVSVEPSTGGLATGMKGPHERLRGLWIGWPGDLERLPDGARREVDRRLAELRLAGVPLSADEIARYYEGYSNAILWPLFHYSVARLPNEVSGFDTYEQVNARFADEVAARWQPGDLVWIHDYQLMLVPAMLRERVPDARIGFFLHIPFPSSEIFRLLPQRERLLEGLLGADLLGFHTATYLRHFASAALRLVGATTEVDRLRWQGREVRMGVFPMGIDAAHFSALASSPEVEELVASHRREGHQLLLGLDRLDYTKGIQRRLLAFEALLRAHPELTRKVRLVQVAVPSRENVEAYRELREEVDALVGRIHGEFATPDWSPIHYLYRGLSQAEIVALYRATDAVLVTPLRDGMNLVAKEFVAARSDGDGVLVLSEFAGAAAEMTEALLVNPYDVQRTAEVFYQALTLPEEERRTRLALLRERVMTRDVHAWAKDFIARLEQAAAKPASPALSPPGALRQALERARQAERLALLLDYDGTLVPFAATPELAAPDAALLALLRRLASRRGTEVHLVSGRRRATMERWFALLPVGLFAEHGFWGRLPGGGWTAATAAPPLTWREPVLAILREFSDRTPGTLIEEKTAGFAWHYRSADPEYGAAQAKELTLHLRSLIGDLPLEILPGDMVLEVRPRGVNKGLAVAEVRARAAAADTLLLAMGDDRTDEDLFAALPAGAIAIHVGPSPSRAELRISGVRAARALLEELLA